MAENRQMMIAALPKDRLQTSDFELAVSEVPSPGDGQVLCRTLALTIGAGQRAGLQGSASYAGAPEAGRVMGGTGVARVEESDDPSLAAGDVVVGPTGWQDYSLQRPAALTKVDPQVDAALQLGVLGTNGLTAYFGVLDVGRPQDGDTVVVSAAAGSVGHVAGQVAKTTGARVVGVAGSDEKCRLLTDELGFDAAVNHRDPEFRSAFKDATPDRIDVYFDNVGGPVLGSALFRMATGGRIACCGVVSQYDTASPEPGPRGVPGLLINNRVTMQGFLVFDFADRYEEARGRLSSWVDSGQLVSRVTEYAGLEQAPQAFVDLLAGGTIGTTIVRVAD
jgi:NADPH-dependent curcumin reductase CurA